MEQRQAAARVLAVAVEAREGGLCLVQQQQRRLVVAMQEHSVSNLQESASVKGPPLENPASGTSHMQTCCYDANEALEADGWWPKEVAASHLPDAKRAEVDHVAVPQ